MATIPPYSWRVPLRSDKPAGAQQITNLATDIAATLGSEVSRVSDLRRSWVHLAYGGPQNVTNYSALQLAIVASGSADYQLTGDGLVFQTKGVYLMTLNTEVAANGGAYTQIKADGSACENMYATIRSNRGGPYGPLLMVAQLRVTAAGRSVAWYAEVSAPCQIGALSVVVTRSADL